MIIVDTALAKRMAEGNPVSGVGRRRLTPRAAWRCRS
jgi:hypothetical protein